MSLRHWNLRNRRCLRFVAIGKNKTENQNKESINDCFSFKIKTAERYWKNHFVRPLQRVGCRVLHIGRQQHSGPSHLRSVGTEEHRFGSDYELQTVNNDINSIRVLLLGRILLFIPFSISSFVLSSDACVDSFIFFWVQNITIRYAHSLVIDIRLL